MAREEALQRLREALNGLAAEEAPRLIDEAWEEARDEVRAHLRGLFVEALLEQVEGPPDPGEEVEGERGAPLRQQEGDGRPPPPPEPGDLVYVYGITRAGSGPGPAVAGVGPDGTVRRVGGADLAALVGTVPAAEFSESALRANLNDIGWLERTARAHEQVLRATMAEAAVIPMRICTLYENDARVRDLLHEQRSALLAALDGVEGRTELGVKVFYEPEVVSRRLLERRPDLRDMSAEAGGAPTGHAYLLKRKLDERLNDEVRVTVGEATRQLHASLSAVAVDARIGRPQDKQLTGDPREMALNASYLVADDDRATFEGRLREIEASHAGAGIAVELTGPWPPYNFAAIDLSGEAGRG